MSELSHCTCTCKRVGDGRGLEIFSSKSETENIQILKINYAEFSSLNNSF